MEKIYFRKFWNELNFETKYNNITYYIEVYPLDIYECDTIVIRVYEDELKEKECGNGIWLDSDFGMVDGNDELYFNDNPIEDTNIETYILKQVYKKLTGEKIIY